jgi:hypothetical protein
VYLASCKKVLVLCGDTYCDRLWCIWYALSQKLDDLYNSESFSRRELYTLVAASKHLDIALSRVQVVNIASTGDIASRLQEFDLANARCYNPNDEQKIRLAIESIPGGSIAFTRLIHEIGSDLERRQ